MSSPKLRFVVLQRVCTNYRVPLFRRLSRDPELETTIVIGDDVPGTKVKSTSDLSGIRLKRMPTRFRRLGSRILTHHVGLVRELRRLDPDVILCEGESHFLGYLQAIAYKLFFKPKVALMHWCFISLPGEPDGGGKRLPFLIKAFFRKFFDAFVLYSSYSRASLLRLGQPADKLFVATNVGDTEHFLRLARELTASKTEARALLGLPDRFTVLYLGTLDANKRPELFLELARECDPDRFSFVLLGGGPELEALRARAAREGLTSIFLPGRIVDGLPSYLRASDALLIPSRGGIVISEAMASGLPVVVFEADGTEFDLVLEGKTGLRLPAGDRAEFRRAIEFLQSSPELAKRMGEAAQKLVAETYTTDNQAAQIKRAAFYARERARR